MNRYDFSGPRNGWHWAKDLTPALSGARRGGLMVCAGENQVSLVSGAGVQTRNGDSIELTFRPLDTPSGMLVFGFEGGMEFAKVRLDLDRRCAELLTSDWGFRQPVVSVPLKIRKNRDHVILIKKFEDGGSLAKRVRLEVLLNGRLLLATRNQNILPEMGVSISVGAGRFLLKRFCRDGRPLSVPEFLHVGGWHVLNRPNVEANLESIGQGLRQAVEKGLDFLVTPETSLTGLFPRHRVTQRPKRINEAECKLRSYLRELKGRTFLAVGLPIWRNVKAHPRTRTRFNAMRVYDPDGNIHFTGPKIHSCEPDFWHGGQLQEFDVKGVPVSMHVCHDGRYPETWTLPVMFGARLIVHAIGAPSILKPLSVAAFEHEASQRTMTTHAFYLGVGSAGRSCLVGPQKTGNLLAVPCEDQRDNPDFPMVGTVKEGLFDARIRIHDAFGYWPMRSFRVSEEAAQAYAALYRARGGSRPIQSGRGLSPLKKGSVRAAVSV